MADAQPRHLEHEDRVAPLLDAAAIGRADVGRHIAHQQFAEVEVMVDPLPEIAPARQHIGNRRIGLCGPVGGMGVVHRHHIRHQARLAQKAGVIRHRAQPAGRLDQKTGVMDVMDPHRVIVGRRIMPGGLVDIFDPRRGIGNRDAMTGLPILCEGGQSGQSDQRGNQQESHDDRLAITRPLAAHIPVSGAAWPILRSSDATFVLRTSIARIISAGSITPIAIWIAPWSKPGTACQAFPRTARRRRRGARIAGTPAPDHPN